MIEVLLCNRFIIQKEYNREIKWDEFCRLS